MSDREGTPKPDAAPSPRKEKLMSGYPANWPRCVSCGDYALDGHLTCGRVECDEGHARSHYAEEARYEEQDRER